MKVFHCDHCGHLLFFENTQCVKCGRLAAYLPDLAVVGSLDRDNERGEESWRSPLKAAAGRVYRLCANYTQEGVCNWGIEPTDGNSLCVSCRLTRVIPDLTTGEHRPAWYRLEAAKRRLIFTLLRLRLPIVDRTDDPQNGLAFEFKSDALTGHANGVITVNVAEADDAERERRRTSLHEPYRTLVGHFRHEIGHYYWDRLVAGTAALDGFRDRFGDERPDYGEALQAYYANGPAVDWRERFISAYASAHPLEDWAETWAHYLHMIDTLETAAACGISLRPRRPDEPSLERVSPVVLLEDAAFDQLIDSWYPVTYVLNNLNRGMGVVDAYPFVWSAPAIEKLRYVHDIVCSARDGGGTRAVEPARPAQQPS
jgi:hypothetical protein